MHQSLDVNGNDVRVGVAREKIEHLRRCDAAFATGRQNRGKTERAALAMV